MANVRGPTASKHRLLVTVTHSILVYGSAFWAYALREALRTTSSFSTISEPAIRVIAEVTQETS